MPGCLGVSFEILFPFLPLPFRPVLGKEGHLLVGRRASGESMVSINLGEMRESRAAELVV